MFCKHCGAQLKEEAKFCPNCGQAVLVVAVAQPEPVIEKPVELSCVSCGNLLKEGALFCPNCGTKTEPENNPQADSTTAVSAPAIPEVEPSNETPDYEVVVQTESKNADDKHSSAAFLSAEAIEQTSTHTEINSSKNEKMIQLISNIERLTQERDQSNLENRKNKESLGKTKAGLITTIIIGVASIIITIIVGYSQYSSMESRWWSANYSRDQLQKQYDILAEDFKANILAVNVTAIKIGNWNNQWITEPGGMLYSSQMRYLRPVITYNSILVENAEITFYVKIIHPNGILDYNSAISPNGYTYSTTALLKHGRSQTLDLSGWGNDSVSSYMAGQWTVEVWYNNMCLRSEKITLQ
jgi:RNA polymerase subunit RPABC4/transcription elongation factor Spt4